MPAQYRAIWTVPGGGTGYSVFHFDIAGSGSVAQQIADDTFDFFDQFEGNLPNDVTISFDSEVLDMDLTGTLTAVYAVTAPTTLTGSWTGSWARAQGLRMDWGTNTVVSGRRLTGRTYIVPVAATLFENNGNLTSAAITAFQGYGDAFIAATAGNRPLSVWSRTHATAASAETCSIPPSGAILRSRRD